MGYELLVHGIDDSGANNAAMDLNLKCSPKDTMETIRQLIAEETFVNDNPEKVQLIKHTNDDEEEIVEDPEGLKSILDEFLDEGDSLYFYIVPFARPEVIIHLKVTEEAMDWIEVDTQAVTRLLVGTSKDYIVSHLFHDFRYKSN